MSLGRKQGNLTLRWEEWWSGTLLQVLDQVDDVANIFHTLTWILRCIVEHTEYSQHHCVSEAKKAVGNVLMIMGVEGPLC